MYKCENCGQQMSANISSHLFPIEIRKKVYPERYIMPKGKGRHGSENQGKSSLYSANNSSKKKNFDKGGVGYETVREIRVCGSCYERLMAERNDMTKQA